MIARRLIVALVMSLLGSALFTFWLSHKFTGKAKVEPPKMQHYVALAKPAEAGEVLAAANLKIVDWPSSAPLEGAFNKPEQVVGRTLLSPMAEGEPVLDRQLSAPGVGVGLAYKIPDGMRAISLRSDQVVGVAGFLLPGTHVDVLVTTHVPGDPNPVTAAVLQDVQILAAGQQVQPTPDGRAASADVVTLLVTPQDAEKALEASAQGTVHFLLRNGADHQHTALVAPPVPSPQPAPETNLHTKALAEVAASLSAIGGHRPSEPRSGENRPRPYTVEMVYGTGGSATVAVSTPTPAPAPAAATAAAAAAAAAPSAGNKEMPQ